MKVCLILLNIFVIILVAFPQKATSLQCYKCVGSEKEPYEESACSNHSHVQNCTGAENSCMIRVIRYQNSGPQSFQLKCIYKVDCERSGTGCKKQSSSFTWCTECCESDLCNSPTFFRDLSTTVPPTSSQQSQIIPLSSVVITMASLWLGYWIAPQALV